MRRALGGFLCLLAGSLAATGEAAGETLEDALIAAYGNNPTLLAERAALRATDEQVPEALSGWRPTVTVTGEAGKSDVTNESAFFTSQEVRTPRNIGVDLSQPIFRGGRTMAATRRAENQVLAGRAQLAVTEQDVFQQTVTAYMDVLRDRVVLDLAINNEQRLRRQLEAARDRFEVGEVTRTDVAQAEARLSNAIAERIAAQGDLIDSRAVYLNVVGVLPKNLSPPAPAGGLPESEREARDIAVAESPDIVRATYLERAARDDVRIVFGELLPTVSLDAEFSRAYDAASKNSLSERKQFLGRLTVPIYQSGAVSARLRGARQTAAQRRLEVDVARRQALENVTRWWDALQTARARTAAFGDSVRANEIALEGVEQEAAVGSRTTLDVLDAEQELFDSKVELVRAQRDEVVASFGLKAAIGRLTAEKLALPVEIYDARAHYDSVRGKLWGPGGGGGD